MVNMAKTSHTVQNVGAAALADNKTATVERAVRAVTATHDEYADLLSRDKTRIRCAMVDPIMWALGWRTWIPSECQPNARLSRAGEVDYMPFDEHGHVAIVLDIVAANPIRPPTDGEAFVLAEPRGRRAHLRDALEIYDLTLRTRGFATKLVETLVLNPNEPSEIQDVANALDYWLGKDTGLCTDRNGPD